jgi:Cache 3/Cache 2 fusion domain
MAATLFVKAGAEYIRVATSVLNPDGSGRAVGTVLGGAALDSIKAGKPYRLRVAGSTHAPLSRPFHHTGASASGKTCAFTGNA